MEREPSVSPTLWPTERAHRASVPGRDPEQDDSCQTYKPIYSPYWLGQAPNMTHISSCPLCVLYSSSTTFLSLFYFISVFVFFFAFLPLTYYSFALP